MSNRDLILDRLMTVKMGTVNNFYSRNAKTFQGALLQTSRYFKELEEKEYIRKCLYDYEPKDKRRKLFYYVTPKGAKYLGRTNEYKYKEYKTERLAEHESMKIDVCLSFLINYPDYNFEFIYTPSFVFKNNIKIIPDILIKMISPNGKFFTFLVEIERKDTPLMALKGDMFRVLIKEMEQGKIDNKYNLSFKTKFLIVFCKRSCSPFYRPQEYKNNHKVQENKVMVEKHMKHDLFSRKIKDNPYRFLNFYNHYKLDEDIWYKGEKRVKLIN